MSRTTQHPFDPEEVMAYLDGELEPGRALVLAAHLQHCGECGMLAAQLRRLSERLLDFQVDPPTTKEAPSVEALTDIGFCPARATEAGDAKLTKRRQWRKWLYSPYVWVPAGALALALLVIFKMFDLRPTRQAATMVAYEYLSPVSSAQRPSPPAAGPIAPLMKVQNLGQTADDSSGALEAPQQNGPMIAQSASLIIVANNYAQASSSLGQLAVARGGYVQKSNAEATPDAARQLSATLRIPAKQLDGFLAELRKLGRVEQESQANDEVTDQYVDLQARLKSARASEQRLLSLLATRTGKLEDVLDAERELARIRSEIERMEGQRILLAHRVDYATVDLQLREEYREKLGASAPSTLTRIRNAAVEGLGNLADCFVGVLVFLLDYGWSILFWSAIILFPAWLVWRRFRSHPAL